MKIRTKLNIIFLLVAFLPLIAITGFIMFYYDHKLEQIVREESQAEFNSANQIFQQNIEKFKELADIFSELPTIVIPLQYHLYQKLEPVLSDLKQQYHINSIGIIDQNAHNIPLNTSVIKENAYAIEKVPTETIAYIEKIESRSYLTVIAPIFNQNKETIIGALFLRQCLYNIVRTGEYRVLMTILENVTCEEIGETVSNYQRMACHPIKDINGQDVAALLARFYIVPYTLFRSQSIKILFVIGVSGILLILLLQHVITRSIIRPVLTIKKATDNIKKGDYSASVKLSGYDEIGQLGNHFNAMAEQIQVSLHQCNSLNEQLERTVESRATELKRKNR